jgi:hypothetical protein
MTTEARSGQRRPGHHPQRPADAVRHVTRICRVPVVGGALRWPGRVHARLPATAFPLRWATWRRPPTGWRSGRGDRWRSVVSRRGARRRGRASGRSPARRRRP